MTPTSSSTVPARSAPPPPPETAPAAGEAVGEGPGSPGQEPGVSTGHPESAARPGRGSSSAPPFPWIVAVAAVLVVLLATGAAYVVGGTGPERYAADVEVFFDPGRVDSQEADRSLATQVVVIEGPSVLGPVADASGQDFDDLTEMVSVSVVQGSQILRIRVVDEDAEVARVLAQDIAETYAGERPSAASDAAREFLQDRIDELDTVRIALQSELSEVQAAPPANRDQARERSLQDELQLVSQQQIALDAELIRLELEDIQAAGARVLAPARALEDPVEPRPVRSAAMGAVVGLLVAAGMVAGALQLRNRRGPG
jgi:capsular polysaccharide biosynthesis protein